MICKNGKLHLEMCANGCKNGTCQETEKCTADNNACKDEKTLTVCDESTGIMKRQKCEYGCVNNACVSESCTAPDNRCIDNNTVQICENGNYHLKTCINGCKNGACQAKKCTAGDNACKDEKTLSACDESTGIMKEQKCEYGCVNNACAPPCAAGNNICIDDNTAQICENGKLHLKTCINGCDNGACRETKKCTADDNACKDEKTLSACDDVTGIMKEQECEYGCAGNACAPPCTADDNKCIDENTVQICDGRRIAKKNCSEFGDSFACITIDNNSDCREILEFELTLNAQDDDILTFMPKVRKLDVVFNVETTRNTNYTIYRIKKQFDDIIDIIRAAVQDSGFTLSMFEDFPIDACYCGMAVQLIAAPETICLYAFWGRYRPMKQLSKTM